MRLDSLTLSRPDDACADCEGRRAESDGGTFRKMFGGVSRAQVGNTEAVVDTTHKILMPIENPAIPVRSVGGKEGTAEEPAIAREAF